MTQTQQGEDGDGVAARRCDNCDTAVHLLAPGACFLLWCTVSLISYISLSTALQSVGGDNTDHCISPPPPTTVQNSTEFVFMKFLIDKAKSLMISW